MRLTQWYYSPHDKLVVMVPAVRRDIPFMRRDGFPGSLAILHVVCCLSEILQHTPMPTCLTRHCSPS